jgi:hypothetical protein
MESTELMKGSTEIYLGIRLSVGETVLRRRSTILLGDVFRHCFLYAEIASPRAKVYTSGIGRASPTFP